MGALTHLAWAWLIAPPGRGYFVVLNECTAYFDEAGTHDTSLATAVSGHLIHREECCEFESDWERALSDYGMKCFRMNRFAHFRDGAEGWDEPKRREFLGRLLNIIRRRTRFSFSVSMLTRDYDYANAVYPLHDTGRNAYVVCALSVIQFVDEWKAQHLPSDAVVKFVFENGAQGKVQLFTDMCALGRSDEISFLKKCDAGALQAADLDAYEQANFLGDMEEWMQSVKEPYDLKSLTDKIRFPFKVGIARTQGQGVQIATVNLPSIERLCERLGVKKRGDEIKKMGEF